MLLCLRLYVFLIKDKTFDCGIKTYTEHHNCNSQSTLTSYTINIIAAIQLKYYVASAQLTEVVLHISCNMGTRDLPDMYALSPEA